MTKSLDLDFYENVIIYNALKNDTYLNTIIEHIDPSMFSNKDIGNIFQIVRDYHSEHNMSPNNTEIKARLTTPDLKKSFVNIVNSFRSLDTTYNIDDLISNTENYLKQRSVFQSVMSIADDFGKGQCDPAKALQLIEGACNISLIQNVGLDLLNDVDSFIDELHQTHSYIPTGYKWFDDMLGGGFVRDGKALYIVSATTNVGKSIMLSNFAANIAAQNYRVLLLTLEMSEFMYGRRLGSTLTGVHLDNLIEQSEIYREDINDFKAENPNSNILIKEFPTKSLTSAGLRGYMKKLHDTAYWGVGTSGEPLMPHIVIVDYLNLMKPMISTGSTYIDVKAITEEVRGLSYEFGGIPFLTATQLNRSAADVVNPGLETTSESFGTSMTCDAQWNLWASEEDKELGIIHCGMKKSRFGPNFGQCTFRVDWDTLKMTESDDMILESGALDDIGSVLDDFD